MIIMFCFGHLFAVSLSLFCFCCVGEDWQLKLHSNDTKRNIRIISLRIELLSYVDFDINDEYE